MMTMSKSLRDELFPRVTFPTPLGNIDVEEYEPATENTLPKYRIWFGNQVIILDEDEILELSIVFDKLNQHGFWAFSPKDMPE